MNARSCNPRCRLSLKRHRKTNLLARKTQSHNPPIIRSSNLWPTPKKSNRDVIKIPFHSFLQSDLVEKFKSFLNQTSLDLAAPLPKTPNLGVVIPPNNEQAIKATSCLVNSKSQVIIYSDGSRIEGKNTAAAAWCEKTKHQNVVVLGPTEKHGIYKAEFTGLILAFTSNDHCLRHRQSRLTRQNETIYEAVIFHHYSQNLRPSPVCVCDTGSETAFSAITDFVSHTWRLKNRWDWAEN
ncbi:hypothetical protein CROQUDRAFT_93932 [Cronartium quercuum f. sp. fusiforme G11]|uniref:Uncharacterized protein n=1 Tax=Cronartium quercuum f. sp. fusiforme G11 TaxID=708437 RepID=A0A9P6NEI2_9BASI|nr:hypothetical protein CROQUDRAFT_93932 [Cronartium quercuum f. sp. fusiforme G11]